MAEQQKKSKEIKFTIELDEQRVPENIVWEATDSPDGRARNSSSIMLSIWDTEDRNTFRIDLWTKEMRLDDMDKHFFQTMVTMAESYQRATNNPFVVQEVNDFCNKLAQKIADHEQQKQQGGQ